MTEKPNPQEPAAPRVARQARRYRIGNRTALEVYAAPSHEGGNALTGEVVDLSQGGIRLRVNTTFPIPDRVTLHIKYSEAAEEIEVPVIVKWHREGQGAGWWIGCVFDEHLSDEVLSHLAVAGFMDRRQDRRDGLALVATVRSEMKRSEALSVRILNCSAGGFSMLAKSEIKVGMRIMVSIQDDRPSIIAKVQWTRPEKTGWTIGCGFLSNHGFQKLREQLADQLSSKAHAAALASNSDSSGWLLGLLR